MPLNKHSVSKILGLVLNVTDKKKREKQSKNHQKHNKQLIHMQDKIYRVTIFLIIPVDIKNMDLTQERIF